MKKLLLISFLLLSIGLFAQQNQQILNGKNSTNSNITLTTIAAYPNPFSYQTQINFYSSKNQTVDFTVKNLLGNTVYREVIDAKKGDNALVFYQNDLLKGMYIYTLQTDNEFVSKRLIIK